MDRRKTSIILTGQAMYVHVVSIVPSTLGGVSCAHNVVAIRHVPDIWQVARVETGGGSEEPEVGTPNGSDLAELSSSQADGK